MTRLLRVLLYAAPVGALGLLTSLVPFLWPTMDDIERADAVVVLSGDHGERLPIAMRLIEQGVAPTLVFNGTPDRPLEDELCAGRPGQTFEAVCLRPQPDSTRAEARAAAVLAKTRGWKHVAVVTSKHHVLRSRLRFNRCLDGAVEVVGGQPSYGMAEHARQVAREWLGVMHALVFDRGC